MARTRWISVFFAIAALAQQAHAGLDRAPVIFDPHQVGNRIQLIWAPGGKNDGTLDPNVTGYTLERMGLELDNWATVHSDNAGFMTWVDPLTDPDTWYQGRDQGGTVTYRVRANTTSGTTFSDPLTFVPSLPAWGDEARDGKARITWIAPSEPSHPTWTFQGYRVSKFSFATNQWQVVTGPPNTPTEWILEQEFIDPNTTIGGTNPNRYMVERRYAKTPATGTDTKSSNVVDVEVDAICAGQPAYPTNPAPIPINNGDAVYDVNDILDALNACPSSGTCILRALPETYQNVSILITSNTGVCPPTDSLTKCVTRDFPGGLIIEGAGGETVFQAPLWATALPAPVLKVYQRTFQLTVRNLVIDGLKHQQVPPGSGVQIDWHFVGLHISTDNYVEVQTDHIGNNNGTCEEEACTETPNGANDHDGRCEAGEQCVDQQGGTCDTDYWPNAVGCVVRPSTSMDNGCIHNVEVRNFGNHGVVIEDGQGWIIEDSEIHDMGCVNRGYGYDCPAMATAPDMVPLGGGPSLPGLKVPGSGLTLDRYHGHAKVRRNEIYRTGKYGISLDNGKIGCNGLVVGDDVGPNDLHDLGTVGIFVSGTRDSNIHDNWIKRTSLLGEPPVLASGRTNQGLSLQGFCLDNNNFSNNHFENAASTAIEYGAQSETVNPTTLVKTQGSNRIEGTTIDGACVEKNQEGVLPNNFGNGAIYMHVQSNGHLDLINNSLVHSHCQSVFSATSSAAFTKEMLDVVVSRGHYETGRNVVPHATTQPADKFCGAINTYGANRKFTIKNDTEIVNTGDNPVEKACVGSQGWFVIGDPDPFKAPPVSSLPFLDPVDVHDFSGAVGIPGNPAQIVQCKDKPPNCDSDFACQIQYQDCD